MVSDKTALVYDLGGSYTSFAQRLSREYDHVYYYTSWLSSYPSINEVMPGEGLDEIERINDFWDFVDAADIIIFTDCYNGDLQEQLVKMGKRVWGARRGDELELDRVETKKLFKKLGLPVNDYKVVIGLDNLRKWLKVNENVFVKISRYRGNIESFHSRNYKLTEPLLNELEHRLGAASSITEFVIESAIDSVCEVGVDIFSIDGKYPEKTLYGLEAKDCGYVGKMKSVADISPLLTDVIHKLSPTMAMDNYRQFFSTETRITKEKTPYTIDLTCRLPSPPSELIQEMITNLGEIIYEGAGGVLVEPKWKDAYGVEIIIHSSWATKNWQPIYFPKEIENFVKIKHLTKINGVFYFVPQNDVELEEIGAVVATGTSIENCVEKAKLYIEQIEGIKLEMDVDGVLNKIEKQIEDMKSVGIEF